MSGHPEADIDSLDVITVLPSGQTDTKTYIFVRDDGHEMTVNESLIQAIGQQAANVNPRIRLANGTEITMDRNRRILTYANDLIDGTLLLNN